MAGTQETCCDDTATGYNPKMARKRRSGRVKFIDNLRNPLPAEVQDNRLLKNVFSEFKYVPYAGSTDKSGHTLLYWYLDIASLSHTTGAAIKKLNTYAFGSRAMFVRAEDPDYSLGIDPPPLSQADASAYYEALTTYIAFDRRVSDFHKLIGTSYKACGNAWVEMVIAVRNAEARVTLHYHKPTRVLYKNTEAGEPREVAISPVWKADYLRKYPAREVMLYPNFTQAPDGTLRTMFHLKHGENDWYGRPDTAFVDLDKANEAQNSLYLVKQTGNQFTPRLIMEVEQGEDPVIDNQNAKELGFNSFYDQLEANMSNDADDPQDVFFASRPAGSRPMTIVQIKPNTNESWFEKMGDLKSGNILRAFGLTPRFMGVDVSGGLSGAEAFLTDYLTNNEPTINDHRGTITGFTNGILSAAWDALGMPDLKAVSLTFTAPIQKTVDDFKNRTSNAASNNNTVGGSAVQPGG